MAFFPGGINKAGFEASSNGAYWRPKKGHDTFDTLIKYKTSLAIFSWEVSNNMTIAKL